VRNLRWLEGGPSNEETDLLISEFEKGFQEALYDDLNVSAALAALFNMVRRVNRRLAQGELGEEDAKKLLQSLKKADGVLAVMPGEDPVLTDREIGVLVREREKARQEKNFAAADRLRVELEARGVIIKDTPQGPQWHWNGD